MVEADMGHVGADRFIPLRIRRPVLHPVRLFRQRFCRVANAINEKLRRRTESSVPQGHDSDGSGSNRQLDRQDLDRGSLGAEPQHRLRQGRQEFAGCKQGPVHFECIADNGCSRNLQATGLKESGDERSQLIKRRAAYT
jgi:hypothetical protein